MDAVQAIATAFERAQRTLVQTGVGRPCIYPPFRFPQTITFDYPAKYREATHAEEYEGFASSGLTQRSVVAEPLNGVAHFSFRNLEEELLHVEFREGGDVPRLAGEIATFLENGGLPGAR